MDTSHFQDVDMDDKDSVAAFLDQNLMSHQSIHNALLEQGVVVSSTPMYATEFDDGFILAHHLEHQAWDAALGLNLGTDLSTPTLDSQASMNDWLTHHAYVTQLTAQALGL